MNSQTIKVSVLNGSHSPDPALQETLQSIDNLRLLKGAEDPGTFLTLHQEKPPDLVLVELNGRDMIPGWLEPLIESLPRSEILVCSASRDPDFLIQITKLRLRGFIPLPLNREELLGILEGIRIKNMKGTQPDAGQGQILALSGTRGGVGTTSVATNLAVALAKILTGGIILVDLARPFPQVGQFLDLKGTHTILDLDENAGNLDPVFIEKVVKKHKSGLDVLLGHSFYHPGSHVFTEFQSLDKICATLRSSYDWVVVDLGAWLDMTYVRLLQETDQVLLVTELTVPDLQNLKFIKSLWRDWDVDDRKMRVLVNHYAKDYSLGLKDLENFCFQPAFATLPHDYRPLMEAINQGMALGEIAPRSRLWRSLKGLAADLVAERQSRPEKEKPVAGRAALLRRLFS
jgi:pilus assembly protein CpaE